MTEWLYKAKEVPGGDAPRPDLETTRAFAVEDGILCRSAYNKEGHWIANVQGVKAGHTIHLYFKRHSPATHELVGSFRVRDPGAARLNSECDLALLQDADLVQRLREAYKIKADALVTGWLLDPAQDVRAPADDEDDVVRFLGEQPTLVRYHGTAPASGG